MIKYGSKKIPGFLGFFAVFSLVHSLLFSPNFELSVIVFLFPLFAYRLLWLDSNPNVLFWGVMLQWVTAATQLIYCNFIGITLNEKVANAGSIFPGEKMNEATLLNIIGLYFFVSGLFIAVKNIVYSDLKFSLIFYNLRSFTNVYIILSIIIFVATPLIWNFPTIVQYFYFLFYIKWGFFVVLIFMTLKFKGRFDIKLILITLCEILMSFVSFFAGNLISVILFLLIGMLAAKVKFKFKTILFLLFTVILAVNYLIIWSSVKQEYRKYINKDEGGISVTVSPDEARAKLFSLITQIDKESYLAGIEKFVDRLGYIEFFAATLNNVPNNVPFQGGGVYLSAFKHYLLPRFLFPDKEVLDDSKHTRKYTGINVSGSEASTSFSIGYVADAYIDFGKYLMHLLLLSFGIFVGFLFKLVVRYSSNSLWIWILSSPFVLLINMNGADTKKAVGFILIYSLTILAIRKILVVLIDPIIRK